MLRGKWILEAVLGTPPPPPPPNVPDLKEETMRRRPAGRCASVWKSIVAIRYARAATAASIRSVSPLENYDVLGRWRTEDSGKPIDNRGELPDGTKIDGPERAEEGLARAKDRVPSAPHFQTAGLCARPRPDCRPMRAPWTGLWTSSKARSTVPRP